MTPGVMGMTSMTMTMSSVDIIVDVAAVIIGLAAIYFVLRLNKSLGGKIKSALRFYILGIFANVFAMIWTAFFGHTYTIGAVTFDIHNVFMAIGMVFFTVSTYRFSLLVPKS